MKKTAFVLLLIAAILLVCACSSGNQDVKPSTQETQAPTDDLQPETQAPTESTQPETQAPTESTQPETQAPTESTQPEIHVHTYDQRNTDAEYCQTKATCQSAAVYYMSCVCGQKGTDTFVSGTPLEHTFDQKVAEDTYLYAEATCKSKALYYYSCTCGEKGTATFTSGQKKEHSYTATMTVAATCGASGYTQYTCECGSTYNSDFTSPTYVHDFYYGEAEVHRAPDGSEYFLRCYLCHNCDVRAKKYGHTESNISDYPKTNCYYYITGDIFNDRDYVIVIYGSGEMPNFDVEDSRPVWFDYLERAKKVIVAEGVTTIGSFAFYNPYAEQEVEFVLPDSLEIIECYGIGVPTNNLHVGKNLEQIREEGIDYSKVRGTIYLPKTLNLIGKLAWDKEFCYEGTLEEFYKINTVFWGEVVSMEDFLNRCTDRKRVFLYINAEDINDKHQFWR